MDRVKPILRVIFGVAFFALGVALFFEVMNIRGFFGRFGDPDAMHLLAVSALAGMILPPLLTSVHLIYLRSFENPVWNREVHRLILGAMGAGVAAELYASYTHERMIALGFIAATIFVSTVCLYVVRIAPGGIWPAGDFATRSNRVP